mmetsp:Transcript_60678/g.119426  ORF Transcript_60678/g.119426 Transcript_60678/m.119426 type:complete len:198 (+) Transcript_60678:42-635(+)
MFRRLEIDLFRSVKLVSKKNPRKLLLGGSFGAMAFLGIQQSHCARENNNDNKSSASYFDIFSKIPGVTSGGDGADGKEDPVGEFIQKYMPEFQKLGFGGVMGICTGVALKRLGNEAAAIVGMGFVVLQGLSYLGYVKIDYGRVAEDANKIMDADGDGKLTTSDIVILWNKAKDIFCFNLPGASGFSAGFAMGLYFGN